MFRANNNHHQQTLLDTTQWMNPKIAMTIHTNYVPKHGVVMLKELGDYIVPTVEVISIVQNIVLKLGKDK